MFYLFLRETETEWRWGRGEREGDTESEAGSRIWAVSTEPNTGLEPMNCEIMTWAEVWHLTNWATQAPLFYFFNVYFVYFWERKRGREQRRGREGTEHKIWSGLHANSREPNVGLKLTTCEIMTWVKVRCHPDESPRYPCFDILWLE